MTLALLLGALLMAIGLLFLRAGQPTRRTADVRPAEIVRLACRRRLGSLLALTAPFLTGLIGGARDVVLLLAFSALAGWALALTAPFADPERAFRPDPP